MFERYTEAARRALFFARYELTSLGGGEIKPEHILLGLLRESTTLVGAILTEWNVPVPELRQQLEARARGGDKLATSVEVPFSASAKRILNAAAEEADRLLQYRIEPEHMLLGVIQQADSVAAASLTNAGLTVESIRDYLVKHSQTRPQASENANAQSENSAGGRRALASIHIQKISELVRDLEQAEPNTAHARDLVERIHDELMVLQEF